MAIITISRQLGSLGNSIGEKLQEKMGLNRLDKTSLEKVFHDYGFESASIEKFDEKKPSFWENFSSEKDRYLHFLKKAVFDFVKQGKGIILGRGAAVLLNEVPGVLKVRIHAPNYLRVRRIMNIYSWTERQAAELIRHSDRERSGFHRFFFDIPWDSNDIYDLKINTRHIDSDSAADLISAAVANDHFRQKTKEQKEKISDLRLGHEIVTEILYREKIPIQFLEAKASNGHVVLRGSTMTKNDIQRCTSIARSQPRVKSVDNQINFIPVAFGLN